jgi:tetratricopeptide (TPR) repeat protein
VDQVQLALAAGGAEAARRRLVELEENERGRLATADQMVGPHDARSRIEYGRCWFPADRDGEDQLELELAEPVLVAAIEIHGTGEQGGLVALQVREAETQEWLDVPLVGARFQPYADGLGSTTFGVAGPPWVDAVRLEIDHGRIEGSNVVDAVALVAPDGGHQWVTHATATSDRSADALGFVFEAPNEAALERRCLRLRDAGLLESARRLARFTAEHWPEAWRAQATLGRVLVAVGETADAAESLRRALELDPGDPPERRSRAGARRARETPRSRQ